MRVHLRILILLCECRNTVGKYIRPLRSIARQKVPMLPFTMWIELKTMMSMMMKKKNQRKDLIKLIQWKASFLPRLSNIYICYLVLRKSFLWINLYLTQKHILLFVENGIGTKSSSRF